MSLFDFFKRLIKRDIHGIKLQMLLSTPSPHAPLIALQYVRHEIGDPYLEREVWWILENALKPAIGQLYVYIQQNPALLREALDWLLKAARYTELLYKYQRQRHMMSVQELLELQQLRSNLGLAIPPVVRMFASNFPWSKRPGVYRGLAFSAKILVEAAKRLGLTPEELLDFLSRLDSMIRSKMEERKELQGANPIVVLSNILMEQKVVNDPMQAQALAFTLLFLKHLLWGNLVTSAAMLSGVSGRSLNPNPQAAQWARAVLEWILGPDLVRLIEEYIWRATNFALSGVTFKPRSNAEF